MADTQFVALLADDEQTLTLDADYGSVEVVNLGTAPVYARTDGVAATVEGDGCEVVLPNGTLELEVPGDGDTEISVISGTAGSVGVHGGPQGRRSGAGLSTTNVAGEVETLPQRGALTDGSGALAAADASEEVFAAKADRKFLLVQNQSAGDLWIAFGGDAVKGQPSILIPPRMAFVMESGFVETGSVEIIGGTLAQAFTAKEA